MLIEPAKPGLDAGRLAQYCRTLTSATGLGLIVASAGLAVLAGWGWNIAILKSAWLEGVTMKPNSAIGFIVAGWSLATGFASPGWKSRMAMVWAASIALLGLTTLLEIGLNLNPGIDQWLLHEVAVASQAPVRMATATATNFVLFGSALMLSRWRRTIPIAQCLTLLVVLTGLLPLSGYLYGTTSSNGIGPYFHMSFLTAALFVLAGVGLYARHPEQGLLRTIAPESLGGWLMRRLLPFVFGVPLCLGWLHRLGSRVGLYDDSMGDALLMTSFMMLQFFMLWWTARTLSRIDRVRQSSETELRTSRVKLAQAMNLAHLAEWEYDVAANQFILDERFYNLYGTTTQREGGCRMSPRDYARQFLLPEDQTMLPVRIAQALQTQLPHSEGEMEHRIVRRDGSVRHILVRFTALRDARGEITRLQGANQDITELKETTAALRAKTALFEAQVNASIDGILVVNQQNQRIIANRRVREIFNVPFEIGQDEDDTTLLQHNLSLMKDPDAFLRRVQYLNSHREESGRDELELKNGVILDRYSAPVLGADGHYYGRIWTFRDITDQKRMEDQLRAAANIDKLTGLPNRALLSDRLQQAVIRAERLKDYCFAVLFLDMDRFKLINDSLGHEVGDLMLQEIGRRLNSVVRIGDSLCRASGQHTTARLGGDEFVILLDGLARTSDATVVAQRLLDVLAQPFRLREHDIYSTASIGIVTNEAAAENAEQVLRDADTAMYEAKLAGKGRYAVFGAPMRQRVQKRLSIETDLRKAVESDQFFLLYEPIVSLATGKVERYEALLRWQHPGRGLVMPGEFVAVAEETGLILPLGEWALREACRQFTHWRQTLGAAAPAGISVNLSRTQLLLRDLPERIRAILRSTGMPADRLHLEVTESAVMQDALGAVRTLCAIKDIGVKLDIDDFGTGYSSLSCLREFPMDVLKIDRSFITNIERGRDFTALVHAVTQLARNLRIQVVGEGIETVDQALLLQSLDCDFGQGYFFSKPMSAAQASLFSLEGNCWTAQSDAYQDAAIHPLIG